MEPAALGLDDALVGRLLDEGVAEAVGGTGLLGHLGEQAARAQLAESLGETDFDGADGGQFGEGELNPEHRGGHHGVTGSRAQAVHPGPDQAFQGLGHGGGHALVQRASRPGPGRGPRCPTAS